MRVFCMLGCLAACSTGLAGEDGFAVGRAQLVPCESESGVPGALLVIESLRECWISQVGERPGCFERSQFLLQNPAFCTPDVVVDSPSETTMTGFFQPPLDPTNYLAAGMTQMYHLPCNPGGRGAEWSDFQDFVSIYEGAVRVTRDGGSWGRLQLSMSRLPVDGEPEPETLDLDGEVTLEICR